MTPPDRPRKSAAWWDDFWARPLAATGRALTCRRTAEEALRLLRPALAQLPPGGRLRLLDLGCGHGDLTLHLLRESRLDVVALDVSAAALDQFQARLRQPTTLDAIYAAAPRQAKRLSLIRGSVYELPFPDGAFDAVVSFGYASAASYEGAEREVARVLRPGGIAVVDFANPSLYHWLGAPRSTLRWYRRFRDPSQSSTYHFGWRGLRRHFGSAGLQLDGLRYLNAYPPSERIARRPGSAPLDAALAWLAGPLLGRVLLARLRRR